MEITREEMMELVQFDWDKNGTGYVKTVKGDVRCDVVGSVGGSVRGDVRGIVGGSVWGDLIH